MNITTTDLPEALQKLFLEIEQINTPVTVIHEGKPLVIITPAKTPKPRPAAGFMKGSGKIVGDIIAPIEQPWEVLQ
jgi:hypothetical protein